MLASEDSQNEESSDVILHQPNQAPPAFRKSTHLLPLKIARH